VTDILHTPALGVAARFAPEHATDRLDRTIWLLIAAVAIGVLAGASAGGFSIAWKTLTMPGAACAALLTAAWLYRNRRKELRLASALGGTAQMAAFAAVGAPLSYLAARTGLPLQDPLFDAADKALGFDWAALLAWMNAHRGIYAALSFAYMSFMPQATIAICVLAFSGRAIHLRVFMLAFVATALVTIAISGLLPAEGAWLHYALHADANGILPSSSTSWPVFHAIRDGSLLKLMAAGSEGIITFPSLHAALGLIFALAFWPVPVLRWFGLALNVLMIAATPIEGSHYLSDVIAGLIIATLCWLWAARLARKAAMS
jgi:membrane-associated phospholipid phosphatase